MSTVEKQIRRLEKVCVDTHGRNIEAVTATVELVTDMANQFASKVDEAADLSIVLSVFRHNPDTMIAFRNQTTGKVGGVAILPLNSAGHIALSEGVFDTACPKLDHICKSDEKAASVYIWAIDISTGTTGGISIAMEKLNSDRFSGLDLYCKAANDRAYKLFKSMGFQDGALIGGRLHPEMMSFERQNTCDDHSRSYGTKPSYSTFDPNSNDPDRVGIKIVHDLNELVQALSMRAAAYLPEQDMPYAEDVDGNDFCGAHLLGYVGREPAATLRLRFFSEFIKVERLAVLPRFRRSSIGQRIVQAGIDFGRDKGYVRFYGQSEKEIFPLWRQAGFIERDTPGIRYLTDRVYHEGDLITTKSQHAITPNSGAAVIVQREGEWHRPGAFGNEVKE